MKAGNDAPQSARQRLAAFPLTRSFQKGLTAGKRSAILKESILLLQLGYIKPNQTNATTGNTILLQALQRAAGRCEAVPGRIQLSPEQLP